MDRNTGECFFDSQGFRDLVRFLDEFPDEVDYEKAPEAEEEIRANIRYGRQMLEGVMIVTPQDVGYADSLWQERAAFPGFPTVDGSSGSFFIRQEIFWPCLPSAGTRRPPGNISVR